MKWIPLAEVKKFDSTSIVRFIHTKKVLHEHNHFIEKHPDRINTLEYLDESPSDVSVLVEALEYLIKDIKRKPNDTRYATAIKKAEDALAQYSTLTAPADKIEGSISKGEDKGLGLCMECKKRNATKDYNGHKHYVCDPCYNSLSNYFDEEYK